MNKEEITNPIKKELEQVESDILSSLDTGNALINNIVDHITLHKGKRLRPILVLLCSGMAGGINKYSIKAASIIEILHTATLIHDDVIDEADTRHNAPTVNKSWNNKTSVLMGDFLLAIVLKNLYRLNNPKMVGVITETIQTLCHGELAQMQHHSNYDLSENEYFDIIIKKTGFLIAACCQLGILSFSTNGNSDPDTIKKFGQYLGIAFQIKDDLLDIMGEEETIGKPVTQDLIGNTITLPLIYGLQKSKDEQIINILENGIQKEDVATVREYIIRAGGIQYAEQQVNEYIQKAQRCLDPYPESNYKESLLKLTSFMTTRNN